MWSERIMSSALIQLAHNKHERTSEGMLKRRVQLSPSHVIAQAAKSVFKLQKEQLNLRKKHIW